MNRRSASSAHMRYLPVPAPVHELQLSPGALSVYIYLIRCMDDSYHCYPSYKTIGEHVRLSDNTVARCVRELEAKQLIETERTSVIHADGKKYNGNLRYHLLPFDQALKYHNGF
ncbi:helix-turn-helix domain-containing protein [uncultured Dysosmobacter sp.]|uniref:helix-turn-helix domain-containing protein n=1 Tax=uncultured Dysosmobacter sp. TaxID=2591384 RepID=UPI00261BB135|nr:helix-turn-helix domain-containing protein [uncultured Dysosmobacter sp.]